MTAFLAVVRLTCRSALRSNVFRLLLFLLLLCIVLVPNTIRGDGTALGFIQVILEYSLGFVAFILSASSIWLSCSELCTDVENGQLHMIVVKPISRATVWLGKFTGVLLIHTVLLLISSAVIYGFLFWQYERKDFPEQERSKVENEVLTGRRVFMPRPPDLQELVQAELERRIQDAASRGEHLPELDGAKRKQYLDQLTKQIMANMGEVKVGTERRWQYSGLPDSYDGPLYLRYKTFSSSSTNKQTLARGGWFMRLMQEKRESDAPDAPVTGYVPVYISKDPEEILCGAANEFAVPGKIAVHKGTAEFGFANLTPDGSSLYFQQADGPKLMIRVTGFTENYCRAVFVTFLGLAALTGIACAIGALVSMPVAVFLTVSYLVIGVLSNYLLGSLAKTEGLPRGFLENIGAWASTLMVTLLIPLQDFFVSSHVSDGELVEFALIGKLVLLNLLLRGLPLCLFGIWLYSRRELGTAMKR